MHKSTRLLVVISAFALCAVAQLLTPVAAQPMPTCSPGQACKVLSLTTTKYTGAGVSIGGDAGVRFGDGTIQNTAAVPGFSPWSDAGSGAIGFKSGLVIIDGGMYVNGNYPSTSAYNSLVEVWETNNGDATDAHQHPRVLTLRRGTQGSGGAATGIGDPYLMIGGQEFTGTDYYGIQFGYNGQGSSSAALEIGGRVVTSSGNETLAFYVATRTATDNSSPIERMAVLPNGSVLIGSTTDSSTGILQVTGNASATGTVSAAGYLCSGSTHCGTITLSTGSGTATVVSGCHPICSPGATPVLSCTVSSTTLTATGTGSDAINYFCF